MMIEPPREFIRRRVFEIDNRVLVGIKHTEVKQIAWPVQQSGVIHDRFRMDAFFVEACERGRRGDTVKAVTVIKDAQFHPCNL
jgi:hypothetical protein